MCVTVINTGIEMSYIFDVTLMIAADERQQEIDWGTDHLIVRGGGGGGIFGGFWKKICRLICRGKNGLKDFLAEMGENRPH